MTKKLSLAALLLLLLAACGTATQGGSGHQAGNQATAVEALEATDEPNQSAGDEVAEDVSEESEDELGLGFSLVPDLSYFDAVLDSAVGEWDCSGSSAAGDLSDADDDGLAKNATYTVLCTKSFSFMGAPSPVEVKREGTLSVQDKDDQDPTSGYTATGDFVYSYTVLGQELKATRSFQRDWSGNADQGYGFQHTHAWSWSVAGNDYKVEHAHGGSYRPDDAADPFAAGDLSENGSVKHYLNGALQVEVSETAALHLNAACTPPADDGTLELTVGSTTKTVKFTGCGEYTVE